MHVHSGIGRFDDNPDLTMENLHDYSINIGGKLMDLSEPKVMGILNVTPDSFYGASRMVSDDEIAARTAQILDEGASIIDIGAYSSRPGAADVSEEDAEKFLSRVQEKFSDLDVEMYSGGQPIYYYVISVE